MRYKKRICGGKHDFTTLLTVSYTHLDVYKRQVMEWTTPGRRERGSPPITWIEEIQTILRKREIEEDLWMDKQQWKLRIHSLL